MSYKNGQTVIVTTHGINKVAVVLDSFMINRSLMYDLLFEDRSATTMVNTSKSKKTYINTDLTEKLCDSGAIVTTINYNELVAENKLPILRA